MQASELLVVGVGQGRLDQLTLNGTALIKDADLIVYDAHLNTQELAAWISNKSCLVRESAGDAAQLEISCRMLSDQIRSGLRVVRLCVEEDVHKVSLERELLIMKRLGVRKRFVPSLQALHREAWNLRLPWLPENLPGNFRIIPSPQVRGDRHFWRYLADEAQTLALDVGKGRPEIFIERLLLAGADPERPVALVAHHPTRSPICWLTTLEEVDELLPQWRPQGATIVYIGTWPHAIRENEGNKSFWGSLEEAAEVWLKAQRA